MAQPCQVQRTHLGPAVEQSAVEAGYWPQASKAAAESSAASVEANAQNRVK